MNNQKIKETLDMGSFLKELAEEGNVKFGFAKKLGKIGRASCRERV